MAARPEGGERGASVSGPVTKKEAQLPPILIRLNPKWKWIWERQSYIPTFLCPLAPETDRRKAQCGWRRGGGGASAHLVGVPALLLAAVDGAGVQARVAPGEREEESRGFKRASGMGLANA